MAELRLSPTRVLVAAFVAGIGSLGDRFDRGRRRPEGAAVRGRRPDRSAVIT